MPRLRWPPSPSLSPFIRPCRLQRVHSAFSIKTIFTKRCDSRCYYEFSFLKRCSPRYIRDFDPRIFRPFFREAWSKSIWTNGRGRFDRVFFSFATRLFFAGLGINHFGRSEGSDLIKYLVSFSFFSLSLFFFESILCESK